MYRDLEEIANTLDLFQVDLYIARLEERFIQKFVGFSDDLID